MRSKAAQDLLSRVRNVRKSNARPITACIYGKAKHGKTRVIGTFPGPILVLSVGYERGSEPTLRAMKRDDIHILRLVGHTRGPKMELVDDMVVMDEVIDQLPDLIRKLNLKTVAVDTLSLYLDLYKSELTRYGLGSSNFDVFNALYQGTLNLLQTAANEMVHIVLTAHEDDSTEGRLSREIRPLLIGKSREAVMKSANIIARVKKTTEEVEGGKGKSGGVAHKYRMFVSCPEDEDPGFVAGTHFDEHFTRLSYPPTFETFRKILVENQEVPLIMV